MQRGPARFWIGIAGLGACQTLMLAGQPLISGWFTPLAWTFYIFLVDGLLERLKGSSPLQRHPVHMAWTALASVAIWVLFEGYNIRMEGWRYVGLPESYAVRLVGYFWAFATIGPGLFVTRELVEVLLFPGPATPETRKPALPRGLAITSIAVGAVCVASPFAVSADISRYLWAPVWAGFIFAIDPINAMLGRGSLWRDARHGDNRRLWSLLIAGAICGVLWEFWNYWATTKWVYTFPFPILRDLKLFEMPVAGFLGFPPFALEYFAMTELLAGLWRGSADQGLYPAEVRHASRRGS